MGRRSEELRRAAGRAPRFLVASSPVRDLLIRANICLALPRWLGFTRAGPGVQFSNVFARVTGTVSGWFEQTFGWIEQVRRGGCSDKVSLLEVAAMTMMQDAEDWSVDADAEDNRLRKLGE